MNRLAVCLALCCLSGAASGAVPAEGAGHPGAATVKPPTTRQALQDFAKDHAIGVEGLDRIGDEAFLWPTAPQSAPGTLRRMLKNYGYIALWPKGQDMTRQSLPSRLVIIGPNGTGEMPGTTSATTDASAPASTAKPPAQSPLNQKLTVLALQTPVNGVASVPATDTSEHANQSDVSDQSALSGTVAQPPMTPTVMASLTRTANQQVKAMALALRRIGHIGN